MKPLKISIAETARLPFEEVRGSEKERFKKSAQLSSRLLTELSKVMHNNECSVDDFRKILDSVLAPYKINYSIHQNVSEHYAGSLGMEIDVAETANEILVQRNGFKFFLPMRTPETINNKFTILHEAGHLFDHITNPKTQRMDFLKQYGDMDLADKVEVFKREFVEGNHYDAPLNLNEFKDKIQRLLAEIPDDVAIESLMSIRNTIKTERHQYVLGIKKMLKNPFENFERIVQEVFFLINYAKFKQRLAFANQLLKEKLASERSRIQSSQTVQ
ncbi:MAG: hypothetical protein NC408_08600 [Candidatus Gastranaerophilales bacterium]|nr:hypothetical protein [Candidatus Gastranaerophilales bacterium]MCM1073735.1 hypothetical protein [Bacteroides sp.]